MIGAYTLRSLHANRRTVAPALLIIAATIGATGTVFAMVEGILEVMARSGRADGAVVLEEKATVDIASGLDVPTTQIVRGFPQVASGPQGTLASTEFVFSVPVRTAEGELMDVRVRGVDPVAMQVHDNVRVTHGAMPATGVEGLLIGKRLVGRVPELVEGGTVRMARGTWPIVGTFEAPGSSFEAELWADRAAVMSNMHATQPSAVYVRLRDAGQQEAFSGDVARRFPNRVAALSEPAYYKLGVEPMAMYTNALVLIVVMLTVGSVVAAANTLYTIFLGRSREIATLLAIGFTRRRVGAMLLVEGLLIAVGGALLGIGAVALLSGHEIFMRETSTVFALSCSPRVVIASLAVALGVGALSSIASMVQVFRLSVIDGLRA